jgi:uncharacterized protein with PQ loop repeat
VSPAGLLGTLGVVLSIAFAWPQARAARRADDITGVSGPANLLLLLTATTWLLYSAAIADAALSIANGVTVAAALLTLDALWRRDALALRPTGLVLGAWATTLALVALAAGAFDLGPGPVGILGACLGVSMSVPQAWRAATGHGVEGVALSTYVLLMALMATWLAYGLARADAVVWIPNVMGVVVVAVVVGVLVSRRAETLRQQPPPGNHDADARAEIPDTDVMFAPAAD